MTVSTVQGSVSGVRSDRFRVNREHIELLQINTIGYHSATPLFTIKIG